jgi:DNA-binding HxlR family transcriptional regulator
MQDIEKKPGCIKSALSIVGDQWTPLLLKELSGGESRTFSELESLLAGISPRTLSQRLVKLEACGVIQKKEYCAHPPRYTYTTTKKGSELESILRAMAEWGERHYAV